MSSFGNTMTRRKANDDKRPKWVWDDDLEWGDPPFKDFITPLVFNLLVTFKWWRNKERRKRERYRKWLGSARRKFKILPRESQDR
ncbi:MAG: hypothetical protein OXH22_00885 [Chloroflexi bacterium]|nr:hypothetical protein [Chloroflexota bacterium]